MSLPQLYYFNLRGFGEYIRLLFTDRQVNFEDIRLPLDGPEWAELKETMIFGTVPCLKMDGKEMVQTGAIMRHLGRIYDLNGSNDQESRFLDMFFECVRDSRMNYSMAAWEMVSKQEIASKIIPESLEKLEKLFEMHPGDFIIGEKISYADYILFEELDVYNCCDNGILSKFPVLKAFWERMWDRKNLKAYLQKRKDDDVKINASDFYDFS